jgi:putative phosphoribosyl transferase
MRKSSDPHLLSIPAGAVTLEGELIVPEGAGALVIFAHGSGSGRLSPRNRFVAERLRQHGLGTLLLDLLTREEDRVYENRFDIGRITGRIEAVTAWARRQPQLAGLEVGYFGASTGSAAALKAAARERAGVWAVVSRGGRPDLAMEELPRVEAPTLLIVGGEDPQVLELNEEAYARLRCEKELEVVPGAGHLFEEPGALERVAGLAAGWFLRHLAPRR